MSEITLPPGADPGLALPRADMEYLCWTHLRHLGGVVCHTYGATEGSPGSVLATTHVQVDTRSATRARAAGMADTARRILKALPWESLAEVVVAAVECVDGPRWLPDDNGAPRYVARYAIVHHPRQGQLP